MGNELATIQDLFEKHKDQLTLLLPKHVSAERLTRIALASISRNQVLLKCSTSSLLASLMDAGKLGLEASGPLGEGYLVPYFNGQTKQYEAQFQPGYRGLVTLARRSGMLKEIDARVVHENDSILVRFGIDKTIEHFPTLTGDPGKPIAVYAIFHLEGGGIQFDVMTIAEINAIRARSKAKESGPWVTDFEEMAKKTVIKRGLKLVPLSVELAEALEADNKVEFDLDIDTPPSLPFVTPEPKSEEKKGEQPKKEKKKDPAPPLSPQRITSEEFSAVKAKWNSIAENLRPETQKEGAAYLKNRFGFNTFDEIHPDQLIEVMMAMDDIKEPSHES